MTTLPARRAAAPPAAEREQKTRRLGRSVERLLWGMFLNAALAGFLAPVEAGAEYSAAYRLVNLASWIWPASMLVLVARNYGELRARCMRASRAFMLVLVVAALALLSVPVGIAQGAEDPGKALAYDCFPLAACVLAFLGGGISDLKPRLLRVLVCQLLLAIVFAAWAIQYRPIATRVDFVTAHYRAYQLLFPSAFVLPLIWIRGLPSQLIAVASVATTVVLNVLGQNRLATGLFGLVVPLAALVLVGRQALKRWRRVLGAALAAAAALWLVASVSEGFELENAWARTVERMFGVDDLANANTRGLRNQIRYEYEASRGDEAIDFLEWADGLVWLVGAGAGGTWVSRKWGVDWGMVHFGPLHLVLRGGVPLLLAFVALFFHAMRNAWRARSVDPYAAGVLTFLGAWFLSFLSHGPMHPDYRTYVFWIVLGAALASNTAVPQRASDGRGELQRA